MVNASMFVFVAALLCLSTAAAGDLSPAQQSGPTTRLKVADPRCIPGHCICSGVADVSFHLNDVGIRASTLARGIRCIVADYDGNGFPDYAIPGAEGFATVILIGANSSAKAVPIDAGGFLELYSPRREAGDNGEPASPNYSLLVRWVGRQHALFLWNGEGFTRLLFPAH